jgi:hypothetical protein
MVMFDLEYRRRKELQDYARELGLMDDERFGIPRTGYKGVVETRPRGEHFLFMIPPPMQDLHKDLATNSSLR